MAIAFQGPLWNTENQPIEQPVGLPKVSGPFVYMAPCFKTNDGTCPEKAVHLRLTGLWLLAGSRLDISFYLNCALTKKQGIDREEKDRWNTQRKQVGRWMVHTCK